MNRVCVCHLFLIRMSQTTAAMDLIRMELVLNDCHFHLIVKDGAFLLMCICDISRFIC